MKSTSADSRLVTPLQSPRLVHLPEPVLAHACRWAQQHSPRESCALLTGRRSNNSLSVHRLIPCHNQVDLAHQHRAFAIDPMEVLSAEDQALEEGEQLIGLMHSHSLAPARPSAADITSARSWPQTLWLILGPDGDGRIEARAWWADGESLQELSFSRPVPTHLLWSANS
ncbi:MAG: hypothetical protein CMP23_06925 [Rickettsiales bacterium]|nr:hypothetical protein [Rickettsiales bacterium]